MQAESVFAKPDILELNLCSIRGMGAPFVRPANNQHSCGKMQLQKLTRTEAAHLIPPNSFEFLPISRSSAKSAAKPIFLSGLCCGFPFLFFSASPRLRGESMAAEFLDRIQYLLAIQLCLVFAETVDSSYARQRLGLHAAQLFQRSIVHYDKSGDALLLGHSPAPFPKIFAQFVVYIRGWPLRRSLGPPQTAVTNHWQISFSMLGRRNCNGLRQPLRREAAYIAGFA
jgi:hypothetical protein